MNINKYNSEGYSDPTPYEALNRIEQEAKVTEFRPLVFISSPFAGDTERNIRKAQGYCRFAVTMKSIPIAPHLLFPQFMDDSDTSQRDLALFMGTVLMSKCLEMWVFGRNITNRMAIQLDKAQRSSMRIRYFSESCQAESEL